MNTPRVEILQAANRERARRGVCNELYTMRHLHRAVFVCRQNRLVPNRVLEAAGFRAKRSAA